MKGAGAIRTNKAAETVRRLNDFVALWLEADPNGRQVFARLIRDVHQTPKADHADEPLVVWIDAELQRKGGNR